MKITKDMWHEELRSLYRPLSFVRQIMLWRWTQAAMDFVTRRALIRKPIEGIASNETHVTSRDEDYKIRVVVNRPIDHPISQKLPLMLYIPGGGYITGLPEMFNTAIKRFIDTRACVVVSPDYRKAYTKPYPAALNDCYDTLEWATQNAESLGIDPSKIIIAGHSAGGGLTAALTLKIRDLDAFKIAFQMPFYPMIDDRQPGDPAREMHGPGWDSKLNKIGWDAYLSDLHKAGANIPAYAAPMRNDDYTGFPPTLTLVGRLEPFYWETMDYVKQLRDAGIEVAFKEFEACFHGFDFAGGDTGISKEGLDFTYSNYADFYDRFVG